MNCPFFIAALAYFSRTTVIIYVKQLAIKLCSGKEETLLRDEIINLVDQTLQLNAEKQQSTLTTKTEQLQNRIDYCEQRINEIVYELYGLTKEEISLIENA